MGALLLVNKDAGDSLVNQYSFQKRGNKGSIYLRTAEAERWGTLNSSLSVYAAVYLAGQIMTKKTNQNCK